MTQMDQKMQVYKKINSAVEEKKVTSYDQELMNFLVTHKDLSNDKITNYYDSLQSTYSISKCYRFIRYLALGLDIEQIKVCEGYLASLSGNTPDTKFTHCWMELSDSILDTSFIGKWEKETYYDLFQPEIKKEINLKEDENYQTYRQKTVSVSGKVREEMHYIDWYQYYQNAFPTPFLILPEWRPLPEYDGKTTPLPVVTKENYPYLEKPPQKVKRKEEPTKDSLEKLIIDSFNSIW